MDGVVAPFDQRIPVATEEVSTTLSPEQNEVGPLAVIVGTLATVTVIVFEGREVQPPVVCVTVYVPEVVTVMDCVVAPFDQVFPVATEEVSTTLPPAHTVVGPLAEMVGAAGPAVTSTTVAAEVEVQ